MTDEQKTQKPEGDTGKGALVQALVSADEHQALLDQWNEMVLASGAHTHGGAIGHVAGMRATLAEIKLADIEHYMEHGKFMLSQELRKKIQQYSR